MSEDQLRRIFVEGQPDWLEEPSKSPLAAQDVIHLLDTQTYFDPRKLPYPTDRDGVLDRLRQDRLIEKSSDGSFVIRRIGAPYCEEIPAQSSDVNHRLARLAQVK
jgi:ATP-dependent DNA helicase RecG